MKNLALLNDNTNIKLNDTGTVIQFKASNEGQPVGLSNGQSAIFRIKNELGFLKSVTASTSYGGYVFELDTEDLDGLVPDTYQVELLVQVDSDNALIFPDKGFVQFTINANALNITGEQLPVMSLDDFKEELQTYVENQTTTATTNIKNDFDTYVDNLTDNTVATATKASQDATNAVNTANTAKSTADTANAKANANASLIASTNALIDTNSKINLANHFPNSDFQQSITDTFNTIGTVDTSVINQGYGFDNSLKITTSGFDSTKYYGLKIKNMIPVAPGTIISIGALVHAYDLDGNAKFEFGIWNSDKSSRLANPGILITNNNDFTMVKYENYIIPDGGAFIELYPFIYKNGTLEITHPMLVQGSHLPNIWLP